MSRRLPNLIAILTLLFGLTLSAPPQYADARAGCNSGPAANTADLGVTDAVTGSAGPPSWVVTYVVTVTNFGPCNVPGLNLAFDLSAMSPAPASAAITSTSPNSWACPAPTPTSSFSCSLTANVGVPGTAVVALRLSWNSEPTNTTLHSTATAAIPDPSPIDPHPSQNWAAYLFNGGSVQDAIAGSNHKLSIQPNNGPWTVLLDRTNCAPGVKCFDAIDVSVTNASGDHYNATQSGAFLTIVFTFDNTTNPTGHNSVSQIDIIHVISNSSYPGLGGVYTLGNCGKTVPFFGCISDRTQFRDPVTGDAIFQITVTTPTNDSWDGF